ncbi:AraC family transcriptional regulator [Kocuria sp. JC486]|uniref:AraC family transcriptional regulator n=1 Tax=Kocuria soli TaxID=2485125 RepID=A0A3N4A8E2_9MICC|nr:MULTISPECIES: AraC family transcriptional regulator [Kocuria]NHU86184.1 AraC family transcriptional regulator [Kocuria sp. JC486]ROZ61759.1 AraC family transcriptional regulator [Kocuria soli]
MNEFTRSTGSPHFELRRSEQSQRCYRPHFHERAALGVIDRGSTRFTGAFDTVVDLRAGDTIVIPAGHVHACNPHDGAWNYQFLQMDQTWARSQIDSVEQGRAVETWFSGIRVFRSPRLHEAFTRITKMVAADPQDAERVGAHLRKALEECSNMKPVWAEPEPATFLSATRLGSVLERLRDDERNPSLDELAQLAGMTRYQLIRSVKSATGLTPLAWRQNQKIIRARRMLAEGHDLAGTAHGLGFTDQSHFHRLFRAHVAASPGSYRS